ncbi:g7493 [Coccomyxa viridis]|uniref:G7493 protein n=1 Tax=Coccomyxa viridis TaxID=1274662 RepID=A0ABP1FZ50_9CHLO
MNRLARLPWRLSARALGNSSVGQAIGASSASWQSDSQALAAGCPSLGKWAQRSLHTSSMSFASGDIALDMEHATGLERQELEAKLTSGKDIFHEDWLDAPFGTEDKPVEVTSSFSERIVGVPDPYDDSIVWWGNIHEGDPPKQIVEGGEFFILKRSGDAGHGH